RKSRSLSEPAVFRDLPVGCGVFKFDLPKTAGSDNERDLRPPRFETKLQTDTKAGRRPLGGSATTVPFPHLYGSRCRAAVPAEMPSAGPSTIAFSRRTGFRHPTG